MLPAQLLVFLFLAVVSHGQGGEARASVGATTEPPCPPDPEGVVLEEVKEGLADGSMVVVDVREPKELRNTGMIPGSHSVPLKEVESAFMLPPIRFVLKYGFTKPSPAELVYSCKSGKRATEAWRLTAPLGYCDARVFFGSFDEWAESGEPIAVFGG